jgi:glutathione-regulated potassium-efflux system ancillary protein KefC
VHHVEREVFESSLRSGRTVLELLGHPPFEARSYAMRFRRANLQLFEDMYPHHGDRAKVIAVTKQARRQLADQMAQERAASVARRDEEERRRAKAADAPRPADFT